jgi:hypothetical protein
MSFSLEVLHAKAAAFFRISPSFAVHECGELPLEEFERLSEATDLPASLRRELLEDREAEVFRGSLARIDYTEHGPVSDLRLSGAGRSPAHLAVSPATGRKTDSHLPQLPEGLREELLLLMERRYR